jgi:hypothetical protein
MPYSAEVSRANPSCFLFLIDQSGSMQDPIGGGESTRKKADAVADAINKLLQNLVIKCAKSEGVRDYYHTGVIGYGDQVGPAFSGQLAGREMVAISEIAAMPARLEERSKKTDDGAGGLVEQKIKFPIWFDSVANNGTPMCKAFALAKKVIAKWLSQYPDCFPPIVINVTDGESTDGDPANAARELTEMASTDGNVLLFNLHLSSRSNSPLEYPNSESGLPDEYALGLFRISSALPDYMRGIAVQEGKSVSEGARGFVFNADIVSVIQFLDIGTRPSNLR